MRGKKMTRGERETILLLRKKGHSVRIIAQILGRGKSGVMSQIQRMEREGAFDQLDLGRADDKE